MYHCHDCQSVACVSFAYHIWRPTQNEGLECEIKIKIKNTNRDTMLVDRQMSSLFGSKKKLR